MFEQCLGFKGFEQEVAGTGAHRFDGTIDLGNPLAVPVNDQAPTFDGVRTEWRQSALPSGIRLGATSNGWTITVDAASSVNNPGQAASKLMEIALRDLPSAG